MILKLIMFPAKPPFIEELPDTFDFQRVAFNIKDIQTQGLLPKPTEAHILTAAKELLTPAPVASEPGDSEKGEMLHPLTPSRIKSEAGSATGHCSKLPQVTLLWWHIPVEK